MARSLVIIFIALLSVCAAEALRINEFLASNKGGIQDCFGERSDWIEIFNDGEEDVDLAGYGLTDSEKKPFKYELPSTNLAAGSFLLVFASDQTQSEPGKELHSGFKLSASGEYLGLRDKAGTVLSEFAPEFPPQKNDVSFGWCRESADSEEFKGYMLTPTPGAPNAFGTRTLSDEIEASADPGFYEEPFELSFSCDTQDAKIVCTFDGTTPLPNGPVCSSPITIDKTTIVRAQAFKEEAPCTSEFTGTYVFLADVIAAPDGVPPNELWPTNSVNKQKLDYGMDTRITQSADYKDAMLPGMKQLPFLSLVVSPGNLFDAETGIYVNAKSSGELWERRAHIELLNHDGSEGFSKGCGIRIRGSSSRGTHNPKHSFHLYFRDEWGGGRLEYPLFGDEGVKSFKKIDLRTTQTFSWHFEGDAYQSTYCRDEYVRDLALSMGLPATRSRFYHLLLNGHYWGIYATEERPDENFAAAYLGGSKDDYDVLKTENLKVAVSTGSLDAYRLLWKATTNGFSDATYQKVMNEGLLDPTNVADVAIVDNLVCNMDSPITVTGNQVNNFYALYNREEPKGFKFIHHDCECSLLREYYNTDVTTNTSVGTKLVYFNSRYLHQKLMKSDEYKKLFISRVCKHYFNNGPATAARMQALFAARSDSISSAVVCESARWGDIRSPYEPYLPLNRDRDWTPNITYLRNKFIPHRAELTLKQYRARGWFPEIDPPILSICGGTVEYGRELTLIGEKKIVYTLDGSDPWDSETAKAYADSPIVLTNSLTFRCCYAKGEIDFPMRGEADFTVEETPEPAIFLVFLLSFLGIRRSVHV